MAIGYIRTQQGGAIIDVPVVSLGASPLPSKLRAKVPAGTGELPLVYPDDVRASSLRVRQDGMTYAIAKDERIAITHSGPYSIIVANGELGYKYGDEDTRTRYAYLGTTAFNRVTRVELTVGFIRGGWLCTDNPYVSFSGWDDFVRADAWLELRQSGAVKYRSFVQSTPTVQCTHPGGSNAHALYTVWSGTVVLAADTAPGTYDVYLGWSVWVRHQHHNDGGRFRPTQHSYPTRFSSVGACNYGGSDSGFRDDPSWTVCTASQWVEIARG